MSKVPVALSCYDTTTEMHSTIDSKFAAMELALSNKISSLSNQLEKLGVKHSTSVPMETSGLSPVSLVSTPNPSAAALSIADELSDRERRRMNLILYKVPEAAGSQSDKNFFIDLCKTVYKLNVTTTKVKLR